MSDTLTYDEAVAILPEGDSVHTFVANGMMVIGADWPKSQILDAMRASPAIRITGDTAQDMGHGFAIKNPRNGGTLFVETAKRTDGEPE